MKADQIQYLLPGIFQRAVVPDSPLHELLVVMELLHAPSEEAIAKFSDYLDPRQAPDWLVIVLARWVDLDRLFEPEVPGRTLTLDELFPPGICHLRELIARATELAKLGGSRRGMMMMLEVATGLSGFQIDDKVVDETTHQPIPFHMELRVPLVAARFAPLIRRIAESEKPAYVTCKILNKE